MSSDAAARRDPKDGRLERRALGQRARQRRDGHASEQLLTRREASVDAERETFHGSLLFERTKGPFGALRRTLAFAG
jgi:hypothetical protein